MALIRSPRPGASDHCSQDRRGAAALLLPSLASAALVTVDTGPGPATGMLDTGTGLEWLKVSATADMTPLQVYADMAPGGRLERYRYATADELTCGLIPSQIPVGRCSFNWTTINVAPVQAFLERFGAEFDRVVLFQAEPPSETNPQAYGGSIQLSSLAGTRLGFFDAQMVSLAFNRPARHWLVQEVPEPPTAAPVRIAALALAARPASGRFRPARAWHAA